tara:strand:- start:470 stop:1270 length:801 start_codon:yes stop_codon:yes gene_type:complete
MNSWIKKSIELANGSNYLDNLSDVYPATTNQPRTLPTELKKKLKKLYDNKQDFELLNELLKLKKFPIKDPYVSLLRNGGEAVMRSNPATVKRIVDTLRSMQRGNLKGFEAMIDGVEEPKELNRQMGTMFQAFFPQLNYPIIPEYKFKSSANGIAILDGADSKLKSFAEQELDYSIDKGLDIIAKVDKKYVIGEAKFLTDFGGHQNAQFKDALTLVDDYDSPKATAIAILDGVLWIKSKSKMFLTVSKKEKSILSALLLGEFLESLR